MTMRFVVARHITDECDVVEVWDGDDFMACIYPNKPGDPLGVRLITKHGVISRASFDADASLVETRIIKR